MLTAGILRDVLGGLFSRDRVTSIIESMAGQGMIRGRANEEISAHNCCVAALACTSTEAAAVKALAAAMRMRNWGVTGLIEGRRLAPGMAIEGLRDIRLVRVMIAEIIGASAGSWSISAREIYGHGFRFSLPRGDESTSRPGGGFAQIPRHIMEEFARLHGGVAGSQRLANSQLLGRIARSLRPVAVAEAAE